MLRSVLTYLCRGQTTHHPGARRRHALDRPRVKARREGGAANVIVWQTSTVCVASCPADPPAAMNWYPIVNFAARHLVHAESVPNRHGHNYVDLMPKGWVAVAAPRLDRG